MTKNPKTLSESEKMWVEEKGNLQVNGIKLWRKILYQSFITCISVSRYLFVQTWLFDWSRFKVYTRKKNNIYTLALSWSSISS